MRSERDMKHGPVLGVVDLLSVKHGADLDVLCMSRACVPHVRYEKIAENTRKKMKKKKHEITKKNSQHAKKMKKTEQQKQKINVYDMSTTK